MTGEDWSYPTMRQGTTRSLERGLEQILSWYLQREHDLANTLDFQLLELWENQCLWFKALSVWYFVIVALRNEYGSVMKNVDLMWTDCGSHLLQQTCQ